MEEGGGREERKSPRRKTDVDRDRADRRRGTVQKKDLGWVCVYGYTVLLCPPKSHLLISSLKENKIIHFARKRRLPKRAIKSRECPRLIRLGQEGEGRQVRISS